LTPEAIASATAGLAAENAAFSRRYPGETARRQPVHTVYGGAQVFKADTAARLGALALHTLEEFAPDPDTFAGAVGLSGTLAPVIYTRILDKLRSKPVEDFRIDFEDGYGNRPDAQEDAHAIASARETATGWSAGALPHAIGIRIKPFTEELRGRSMRTLDIFLTRLLADTGGRLPENFVVTLAKVTIPAQVSALAGLLDRLEKALDLPPESLKLEIMVETPQAILNERGECNVFPLLEAGRGRCVDDAATGQGLLNFFLRAWNCSAITQAEAVEKSGLTIEELRGRSFVQILKNRRG
jgi:hypothetical protein